MSAQETVKFSSLFSAGDVLCGVQASDRETVIRELLTRLALERGIGNVEDAFTDVMSRESQQSTVVAPGLAVPHARLDAIDVMRVGVATIPGGVGFDDRADENLSAGLHSLGGLLMPFIILVSALGSAFVDNVVFVAAFIPVVRELNQTEFWWALLFGGCFGGNITMIGSTANIVALGMLEKRYRTQIRFGEWLKVGAVVGTVTCLIAWAGLALLAPYMPEREALEREPPPIVSEHQGEERAP